MNKEFELLGKIADRAEKLNLLMFDRISLLMDMEEAHKQFDLRLEDLLNADDLNFAHDIIGIQKHINRETKDFNFFLPRFAQN